MGMSELALADCQELFGFNFSPTPGLASPPAVQAGVGVCPFCNIRPLTKSKRARTCGAKSCWRLLVSWHKKTKRDKINSRKTRSLCPFCKSKILANRSDSKTCGSYECTKKNMAFLRKRFYEKRLREDKDYYRKIYLQRRDSPAAIEYRKNYNNSERQRAVMLRYKLKHRAKINERARNNYWKNRNTLIEKAFKYRVENRGVCLERTRKWRETDVGKLAARRNSNKRRALENNCEVGDVSKITKWESAWKSKKSATCFWCQNKFNPDQIVSDHINPLSKGGKHCVENLCTSCVSCNSSKHAKELPRWNAKIISPILGF